MDSADSGSLDHWRTFFRSANSSIFNVIDHAITVAATDYPEEFKLQRARIAEKLYSILMGNKERKVGADRSDKHAEVKMTSLSNYSYVEAEALWDELHKENEIAEEVLRIKGFLDKNQNECNAVLMEKLRRIKLTVLSVEVLKATDIAKTINAFRRHRSKEISGFAQRLLDDWRIMIEEWMASTKIIADDSPDSVNPSDIEEEGLLFPPLECMALFASSTTSMELSQFFDGIDEDGNPQIPEESNKDRGSGGTPGPVISKQKPQLAKNADMLATNHRGQLLKNQESVGKSNKLADTDSSKTNSGLMKPPKPCPGVEVNHDLPSGEKMDKLVIQNKRGVNFSDEEQNLEAARRKLKEGYQRVEDVKKQRRIRFVDLQDLPKPKKLDLNEHIKSRQSKQPQAPRRR